MHQFNKAIYFKKYFIYLKFTVVKKSQISYSKFIITPYDQNIKQF